MNRTWLGLVFVVLVGLGLAARFFLAPNPERAAQSGRELATRVLAAHLAEKFPGKRVLVLSNPYLERSSLPAAIRAMEEAGLEGLRAGLAGRATIGAVVPPELRPEARENPRAVPIDVETTTPLSYLVAPDAFDRAARDHADCEVIVSLIGLPSELDRCEVWAAAGAPSFAFLLPDLRLLGGRGEVLAALRSGKLAAFVARKPGGVEDHVPPAPGSESAQAEFDRRYVLVHAGNATDVLQRYPGLF